MSLLQKSFRVALLAAVAVGGVGLYTRDLTTAAKPRSIPQMAFANGNDGGPAVDIVPIDPAEASKIEGPFEGELIYPAAFDGDVRSLPQEGPNKEKTARPELDVYLPFEREGDAMMAIGDPVMQTEYAVAPNIPAPSVSFKGLDYNTWGSGHPPDTHGDVGPNHYIQAVNSAIGIYNKTGTQLAAFSFDTLFTGTGTACDAENNGDPVVVYDASADRWIITDFAWPSATPDTGPYYTCIAASKTADPVSGGWWFYAYRADDASHNWLNDYFKLGIWPDGLYMAANMFDCVNSCGSGTAYKGAGVYALNKSDLYSGAALRSVRFFTSASYFTLLPSNQRGTAPAAGTPNYFVANDQSVWALDVWKFAVNWTTPAASTFTGPTQVTIASYTMPPATVTTPGTALDTLADRLMTWNQYRKIGSAESLWLAHTAGSASGNATLRWYQLNVTGGTIATTPVQQATYNPDTTSRWIPSLAVDKQGNMAIGFSAANATTHASIRYAGRLATDPVNQLSQGEATLVAGTGSQSGVDRWGDYASMSVDPTDDCTFWFTSEYYETTGSNWQTRIGSFKFPGCGSSTPVTTAWFNPSANAAVTTSAGDNNGYQSSPTNAYTNDSLFALDTDSGTSDTTTSCTSTTKDKHTYYNYNISVPAGKVINGIEVRLDGRAESTAASPKFCVLVSWDGGVSWTAAKSTTTLTTAEATYILGTSTDTWGRTWSTTELSNTSFRLRVVNVATSLIRDFSLDWAAVRVTYTP